MSPAQGQLLFCEVSYIIYFDIKEIIYLIKLNGADWVCPNKIVTSEQQQNLILKKFNSSFSF